MSGLKATPNLKLKQHPGPLESGVSHHTEYITQIRHSEVGMCLYLSRNSLVLPNRHGGQLDIIRLDGDAGRAEKVSRITYTPPSLGLEDGGTEAGDGDGDEVVSHDFSHFFDYHRSSRSVIVTAYRSQRADGANADSSHFLVKQIKSSPDRQAVGNGVSDMEVGMDISDLAAIPLKPQGRFTWHGHVLTNFDRKQLCVLFDDGYENAMEPDELRCISMLYVHDWEKRLGGVFKLEIPLVRIATIICGFRLQGLTYCATYLNDRRSSEDSCSLPKKKNTSRHTSTI